MKRLPFWYQRSLRWWSSTAGRWARLGGGSLIMLIGFAMGDTASYWIAMVALLPVVGGAGDVSLLARLSGLPFDGGEARAALGDAPSAELWPVGRMRPLP